MTLRIVRLGTAREVDEGPRIGTVRRPPRGVAASEFAPQNRYDVWYPELSPTAELVKVGAKPRTAAEWAAFVKRFKREMALSAPSRRIGYAFSFGELFYRVLLRERDQVPPRRTPGTPTCAWSEGCALTGSCRSCIDVSRAGHWHCDRDRAGWLSCHTKVKSSMRKRRGPSRWA